MWLTTEIVNNIAVNKFVIVIVVKDGRSVR